MSDYNDNGDETPQDDFESQIKRLLRVEPFRPFEVVLSNGERREVKEPFALAIGSTEMSSTRTPPRGTCSFRKDQIVGVEIPESAVVVDDYVAADEPKYEVVRAELRDVIDTLYGPRLTSARDFLLYLLSIEDKLEDELAANSPSLQASLREAQADIAAGRTTPWREMLKDVLGDDDAHG